MKNSNPYKNAIYISFVTRSPEVLVTSNLEAQGLASTANNRGANVGSGHEAVGVGWLGEAAIGSSVGGTAEVVATSNSEATISGVEGLVSA